MHSRPLVLWCDDKPDILALAAIAAQNHGWEIFTTSHAVGALAEFKRARPDAVVLDLLLPNFSTDVESGLDVCAEIRKLDSEIPIIIFTGMDAVIAKPAGFTSGANWTFIKTESPIDNVFEKIEEILTGQKAAKQQGRLLAHRAPRSGDDYLKAIAVFVILALALWSISNRISDARWQGQVEGTLKSDQQHTQQLLKIMKDDVDMSWAYTLILRDTMKDSGLKPPPMPKRPNYSEELEK